MFIVSSLLQVKDTPWANADKGGSSNRGRLVRMAMRDSIRGLSAMQRTTRAVAVTPSDPPRAGTLVAWVAVTEHRSALGFLLCFAFGALRSARRRRRRGRQGAHERHRCRLRPGVRRHQRVRHPGAEI